MRRHARVYHRHALICTLATAALLAPVHASGQIANGASRPAVAPVRSTHDAGYRAAGADRPFRPGETLEYRARFGRLGEIGTAVMSVGGPFDLRGHSTLLLDFRLRGRFGPFGIEDRTRSWVCDLSLASLRYHKDERHPLSSRSERVEVYPDERRWTAGAASGSTSTDEPLDELSFIYHLRTLDLEPGRRFEIDRHYDVERNPVRVHVIGRERISVPAGEFTVLHVEMRVRDGRFGGDGVLNLYFSDDSLRLPVLIESEMPRLGTVRLSLESGRL